ncbi:right-handed parallel beta-helix repeat-containing protein [Kitasatospora sp. NBC_01266]|uniref:right-handed parallel beta-helix repeat-containing protein n=1 Tax=Kitasatospora sp. NBC_01266 TaxID=2903572 RepID=UPI002E33FA7E|nr:right-handed parallel beta-helix repeat-containing protein [Kitasatospora sp. NBC_01266]
MNTAPLTGSGALKTFTSPADKSLRVQRPAPGTRKAAASKSASVSAGPRTIYASTANGGCSSDPGTGAQDSPFCLVQDAVNVAQPGDTIDVQGSIGYFSQESVTVKTSGITIVGLGDQAWITATNASGGKPAIVLDHVSNVTISNLMLTSYGAPAVQVIGSSNVSLDSSYLTADNASGSLTIDGASSGISVSRTYVDTRYNQSGSNVTAVSVASGASRISLASDILAAGGISAAGVTGLNAVGNTIQRGCKSAIDVEGASSGVSLENNVLEDADPTTDALLGGYQSQCLANNLGWAPDITVSSDSAAGTVSDYNDFSVFGSDATAPYSWAGTTYPSLDASKAAGPLGTHDAVETKEAAPVALRPNESTDVDARPQPGSAAIGSANPNAPGALASDFYAASPYHDRGAIAYAPDLTLALQATDTSAYGVTLTATVTSVSGARSLHVDWGDGTSSDVNFAPGPATAPHTYPKLGQFPITATATDTAGYAVSNSGTIATAGSDYTPYGPTRLLDTRNSSNLPNVAGYSTTKLQIAGNVAIPAGVTAVVLNVTATDTTSAGHVTVYGDGDPVPGTSNLNYATGQTVPNMVVAEVGVDGSIDLYNAGDALNLIVDIDGYFTQSPSSGYTPVVPNRLVDTRDGSGQPRVGGGQSLPVQIAGSAGGQLPGSGITAVALNVTVTGPAGPGHLTVYPDGQAAPNASNVNYSGGQTIANSVVVPVGADGRIQILNSSWGAADLIVDVVGYYSAAGKSAYLPLAPERLLDTRDPASWSGGPLPGWNYIYMPLAHNHPDFTGFVLNSTATDTATDGHLSIGLDPNTLQQYQSGSEAPLSPPSVSTLNWRAGQTVPNMVQTGRGPDGLIDFWNASGGNINLVVDIFGLYQND